MTEFYNFMVNCSIETFFAISFLLFLGGFILTAVIGRVLDLFTTVLTVDSLSSTRNGQHQNVEREFDRG